MTPSNPLHSPTAPMTAAVPLPARVPLTQWTGWAGVVTLLVWIGIATLSSRVDEARAFAGPLSFGVALLLLGVMWRWPPPPGSTAFARLGGIVLLAWLLESLVLSTMAWSFDDGRWGAHWLAALVFTFRSVGGMVCFSLIAIMIALMSSASRVSSVARRRELWVGLGIAATIAPFSPIRDLDMLLRSMAYFFPLVGCGWWAGRALRGRATRGWTATIGLVTAVGWAPLLGALGRDHYGNRLDFAGADIVFTLAMVVAAIAGGLALRRHRIVRAQRLWAIAIGFGVIILHNHFSCGDDWMWFAPMTLFLAAGLLTRWRTLVWGAASLAPVIVIVEWRLGIGLLLIFGAEAAVFLLLRHAVMARCARLAR